MNTVSKLEAMAEVDPAKVILKKLAWRPDGKPQIHLFVDCTSSHLRFTIGLSIGHSECDAVEVNMNRKVSEEAIPRFYIDSEAMFCNVDIPPEGLWPDAIAAAITQFSPDLQISLKRSGNSLVATLTFNRFKTRGEVAFAEVASLFRQD